MTNARALTIWECGKCGRHFIAEDEAEECCKGVARHTRKEETALKELGVEFELIRRDENGVEKNRIRGNY